MGLPIWESILVWTSSMSPLPILYMSSATLLDSMLYSFPTCVTGFLPADASMLIGLIGVIRPFALLPLPTEPSSPFSIDSPETVR